MKKTIVALALCAVASSFAAESVTSANIVGFVKQPVEAGTMALLSFNFDSDQPVYIADIAGDLPAGSSAYIWDMAEKKYVIESKLGRGGWSPNTTEITSAVGFWIKVPDTGDGTYDIIMSGNVATDSVRTVANLDRLNLIGSPYPTTVKWIDTELAANLPAGSSVYVWKGSEYEIHSKLGRGGWTTAADLEIQPGEGFWISNPSGNAVDWDVDRPF